MTVVPDKIRWGILGVGNVCEKKSGPAFAKVPHSELLAVMRRTPEKARDYALRHQVAEYYHRAADLLNHADVNAIYIATPPAFHVEYAVEAMKKGKAVYLEKPVALNAAGCEQLIEASQRYGVPVSVAHYRRRLPLFLKVKELLEAGAIGTPRHVSLRLFQSAQKPAILGSDPGWRVDPRLSGGGLFHDLAPHQLDMLYWLFGEPQFLHGFSLNQSCAYAAPDYNQLQMVFSNGVACNGEWSFHAHETAVEDRCVVYGDTGRLEFAFFRNPVLRYVGAGGEESWELPYPEHVQQPMIADVVRYFRGEASNPCSLEDALWTMRMMDAVT